jgi:hypothetical protein
MTYNLVPYVAAGPLRFGMERAAIHALVGPADAPFKPIGKVECDYYPSLGILIEYDEDLTCAYIGLSKPISAVYQGKDLLSLNSKQVGKLLQDDANLERRGDTLTSRLHGIGAVFEYKTKPVTNITLFKEGYYNSSDDLTRKIETLNLAEMSIEEIMELLEKM